MVRDLGSSNGTFHNGQQVTLTTCDHGDELKFGTVEFRLECRSWKNSEIEDAEAAATIVKSLPTNFHELLSTSLHFKRESPVDQPNSADIDSLTARERLTTLLEVSAELTKSATVDALLKVILAKLFSIFPVDRAAILLADEFGALYPKLARDRHGKELGETVPRSISRAAFDQRQAIVSKNAEGDRRFTGQSILLQQVRSTMCVPLIAVEGRTLGVLYVDTQLLYHSFIEDDLNFLVAFAGIAAAAIENSQFAERIRREALARSNFERYFTPGLAAQIASTPDAVKLGGEKRHVAVLFSDIRGFTSMSETMTPNEMATLLSEYFTEMVECVFCHGGTLDKFIGDAVMAQWGAPLAEPDDVDRCLRAAIDMMCALDRLNRRWAHEGRVQLAIGIGLNCGEAFAGNIGSERRLEYTVIGDTVNTASRLCGAAAGGEILISEQFKTALKDPVLLRSHPPMELKGKSHPLEVYSVIL